MRTHKIESLKEENEELKTSLHESEQTIKTQSKGISELKKENKKLTKERADCKKQCQQLRERKRELQGSNSFSHAFYESLSGLTKNSAKFFGLDNN